MEQKSPDATNFKRIGILDLLGFLFGFRHSILRVVYSPHILWLAAFLVFTAAVAREYDAVSLADQPWDLLGPFGASLFLCTIIFGMIKMMLAFSGHKTEFADDLPEYKLFLSGYWLTAPLAWLYAFPIETLVGEIDCLRFNLTALSVVSIWRVLLFSRVVSILYAIPFWCSLVWVLVPCMIIAFGFLVSAILPMVSIMGGIRMTQSQAMLFAYQNSIAGAIFYAAIPVLCLSLLAIGYVRSKRPALVAEHKTIDNPVPATKLSKWLWGLPVLVLAVLCLGASYFQPRLWHAARVDQLLIAEKFSEAIDLLQTRNRRGFPEAWDPPPKYSKDKPQPPSISKLIEALNQKQAASWINDLLLNQADEILFSQGGWNQGTGNEEYVGQMLAYSDFDLEPLAESLRLLSAIPRSDLESQKHEAALEAIVREAILEREKRQEAEQKKSAPVTIGSENVTE